MKEVARPEGLEPPTLCFEGRRSIQLSYGRPRRIITTGEDFGCCFAAIGNRLQLIPRLSRLTLSLFVSGRIGDRFYSPQKEYIARDPKKQKGRSGNERSRKRMRRLHDVAGKNRRRDSGELITKIQNSPQCADAFSWSNQRGDRPSYGRSGGQSADRHADPEKRGDRTVCLCRAENSQTQSRSADEHDLANTDRAPTALYQLIHEPATHDKVGERGEQPGHTGIERRLKQIHVESGGKIRRQPGQEQIESIVV